MGGRTSTIWYVDAADPIYVLRSRPEHDEQAAEAFARHLYPDHDVVRNSNAPITIGASVAPNEVAVGCYPGVTVVCSTLVTVPRPSTLPAGLVRPTASERTYLVATDPERRWGAFAEWDRGALRRCFSATAVHILEDHGIPMVWELPFWAGEHPQQIVSDGLPDPQTLPFDTEEFADAANEKWLGFRYGEAGDWDPASLPVTMFSLYREGEPHTPTEHSAQPRSWNGGHHSGDDPDHEKRGPIRKWLHRKGN